MAFRQIVLASLGVIVLASAQSAKAEGFGYCYASSNGQRLVTPLFTWVGSTSSGDEISAWKRYLRGNWGFRDGNLADCTHVSAKGDADRYYAIYLERSGARVVNFNPQAKSAPPRSENKPVPAKPATSTGKAADQVAAKPSIPAKPATDYEAEYQAKLAAHRAEVADFERKKREREEQIARQNAAHVAAQEAAAREMAAYEEKLAAHRRELDEANRRQQAYFEAQRRHALCVNGDRKWCNNPATAEAKMADAGQASTDTDAMRCVTNPEVFPSRVQKNTIEARINNNCETSVDIVICLNRPEGWHCGVQMGVSPGGSMSWDARNGNGQVYWDARVMGNTKPLGRPN